MVADVRPAVLILLTAVVLLLVTATANVANVQLARATTRRREIAVRAAIGADSSQLIRPLLIENAIIGLCGDAAGVIVAACLLHVLPSLLPAGFPRVEAIALDWRVLAFATVIALVASSVCGLLPAWQTRRLNLVEILTDGAAPVGGVRRVPMARLRGVIMTGQVAIACVLLVGAVLLVRSFVSLTHADRGYDPVSVLTAELPLPRDYPVERRLQLHETLAARLDAVPGVTHAAFSSALPFVSIGGLAAFTMRSPNDPAIDVDVEALRRVVSPAYFEAMRLRLIAGRTLSASDTTSTIPARVVNQSFARQYLGDDPVGTRIERRGSSTGLSFSGEHRAWEIVGIVEDMRQDRVDAPPQPEVFVSFRQIDPDLLRGTDPILVVRTASNPVTYVSTVRAIVREEAPTLALDSVMTMEERVGESLARPRLYATVLAWLGTFAALIAGVGLFGVVSFTVAQRTREIGVRSALGAQTRDIVALVLRQVLWIVSLGVVIGLAIAVLGARLLSTFLYGISPHDVVTLIAVPIAIVVIAAIACLLPARRAAQIDPATTLRR
jgi:putative ABC transport system permease protein